MVLLSFNAEGEILFIQLVRRDDNMIYSYCSLSANLKEVYLLALSNHTEYVGSSLEIINLLKYDDDMMFTTIQRTSQVNHLFLS